MKLKTHKMTAKKIRVTRSKTHKKFMTKHNGQDHFNAREPGKTTRHKRRDMSISKPFLESVKRQLPYS